jgi:hypothetical protein
MKVNSKLQTMIIDSLSYSMPVHTMVKVVRRIIPNYDLHKRTGFPESIPIPGIDAAKQITSDIISNGLFMSFVETLVDIYNNGLMGRKINIHFLSQIMDEIEEAGFYYNTEYGVFQETEYGKKTRGWGILQQGKNYELSFLGIDIVHNTELVRRYSRQTIIDTYNDLKDIVAENVEARGGRIWEWEGDGGLAAFFFRNKNTKAVLTGVDILLELFLYNLFDCMLDEPLLVRMAIHTGPCQFLHDIKDIKSDTLRRLEILESTYTEPNYLTISPGVYSDLGNKLERFFSPEKISSTNYIYKYHLKWEQ